MQYRSAVLVDQLEYSSIQSLSGLRINSENLLLVGLLRFLRFCQQQGSVISFGNIGFLLVKTSVLRTTLLSGAFGYPSGAVSSWIV